MIKVIFISLSMLLITGSSEGIYAQVIAPEKEITSQYWTNLHEYLFAHTNTAYRTYDLTSYEWYGLGYASILESKQRVFIDGLRIHTNWLTHDLFSLPNINPSDLDSIQINSREGRINLFTKAKSQYIAGQIKVQNQINDPGIFEDTEYKTPNVERVSDIFWSTLNLRKAKTTHFLAINSQKYSRTGRFIYDKGIDNTLNGRTFSVNQNELLQYNIKKSILYIGGYKNDLFISKLLFNIENTERHFLWEKLSGIEVPFQLFRYQISSSFELKKPTFYKKTSFSFSNSKSDSLANAPTFFYDLEQINGSHSSSFQFPFFDIPIDLEVKNEYLSLKDVNTFNEYNFIESSLFINLPAFTNINVNALLANTGYSVSIKNPILGVSVTHQKKQLFKTTYNYLLWSKGIGFSKLNEAHHTLINHSNLEKEFTALNFKYNVSHNHYQLSSAVNVKHYWNFVNENIIYTTLNGSRRLGSTISYFDSEDVGIFSFNTDFNLILNDKLSLKSMLTYNSALYGNNSFLEYYKSVPTFVFSEIIRYTADENFVMELFFRYIPSRRLVEYESLEKETGFPPSRVRPIPLLNFSTSMWFFDRRFETKITLRNLLNIPEAYDTNGQYYYMSINVAARINFGL